MKSKLAYIRRGQRVIRMVTELHKMGYQHLRIMPYMHPLAWRLAVGHKDSFSEENGASLRNTSGGWDNVPIFSSACNYFEWTDAETDNARALAEKFVTRFPDVSSRGLGRDWAYAGWLAELLGVLEMGDFLPVLEWEYMKGTPDQLQFIPIWSFPSGSNNIQWDEGECLSESADGARQFPLPPAILKSDEATHHWSEDRYWCDALDEYCRLRESGQSDISLNIADIEREIYNGTSPAYRLMDAMCSVKKHEVSEGFKGAPRLLLAALPLLSNLGAVDPE